MTDHETFRALYEDAAGPSTTERPEDADR